jgi:phosphoglycolate phosphatase
MVSDGATILLFDIDGTLIDGSGAGRRAMERALLEVAGRDGGLADLRLNGMTDRAIVRHGLRTLAASDHDEAVATVLARYLERLPAELAATPARCLPGVFALLDALAPRTELALGLGTGNLEPGADLKLRPLGLRDRFAFGGFGSDHEDRAELLRIGVERGAARLGRDRAACRVIVIGDTPRDVAAAQAIGAPCLGVATSAHSLDELRAAGATWAVPTLEHPDVLAAILP